MLWNAKNGTVAIGITKMYYISFGSGDKTLILLPGLSDGLVTVKGKAPMLAALYRILCKQYTVYMFSRKNDLPENCSIRDMAADQAEAMRKLGIEKASVVGVSEGGMIAQLLAIDDPDLVENLVIVSSAPSANELVRTAVTRWIETAKRKDHKQLMIDTVEMNYSEARLKQYRKTYPVIGMVGKPKSYRRFLINANAILNFDAKDEIGKISCPVLIIAGEEDKIVGVQASYEMKEKISGSSLYIYPGLGHAVYEEAKDFNKRILDFLNGAK